MKRKPQPGAEAKYKAKFVPNQDGKGDAVEQKRATIPELQNRLLNRIAIEVVPMPTEKIQ